MKKTIYIILGTMSFITGIVGIFLPVLPTTPFILLSTFCFSKSSQTLHNKLKNSKIYRFYAEDFAHSRAIPLKRKFAIIIQIYVLMGISIYFAPILWVKFALIFLTVFMTIFVFVIMPTKK